MVSVIVPVYNAEKFIGETIESVIAQTYTDWELLLVDDRSSDNSRAIIEEYADKDERIIYILQDQNKGAWAARNRGIDEARGDYIAFLDADDKWEPLKLEHQLILMARMKAGFCFTGYEFADENLVGTGAVVHAPKTVTLKQAFKNTNIFTSTVLFDRKIIPDSLIHMPNMKSEDTATWWTILKAGFVAYGLDENLVKYRRSAGTLSSNKFAACKRIWNLYRKIGELNVIQSAFFFVCWAFTAVGRRINKH